MSARHRIYKSLSFAEKFSGFVNGCAAAVLFAVIFFASAIALLEYYESITYRQLWIQSMAREKRDREYIQSLPKQEINKRIKHK